MADKNKPLTLDDLPAPTGDLSLDTLPAPPTASAPIPSVAKSGGVMLGPEASTNVVPEHPQMHRTPIAARMLTPEQRQGAAAGAGRVTEGIAEGAPMIAGVAEAPTIGAGVAALGKQYLKGKVGAGAGAMVGGELGNMVGGRRGAAVGGVLGSIAGGLWGGHESPEAESMPLNDWPTAAEHQAVRANYKEGLRDALKPPTPEVMPISEGPTALEHEAVRAGQKSALRHFNRPIVPMSESPTPVMGGVGKVGSAEQEAGYQPPVLKIPEPKNAKILRAEQVPGPDTAGKGNLLTPAAKRGEEGAGAELMGRGRKVLYTVPEYEGSAPKMKTTFREPRYAYRGTNPGEEEISGAKYDQLSTSPEEAASYARQKGGKLIRVDLNKLPEGSFDISGGMGMPNLIRTLKPIPKHMLEEIPLK